MWEVILPILDQYGLPVGLLLCAVLGLIWAWKRERDENRTLNKELRKSAKETADALVAVKDAAFAQRDIITAIDNRLSSNNAQIKELLERQHDDTRTRLEEIDKRLIELCVEVRE